jgi:3-hydroxyacyl-[acyl-carrier protein] dehydratase/trans-2-decenoyl-[acyl-carrier protein] isomerase
VLNFSKKVKYTLHIKRVIIKRLALAVADGIMSVDGKNIYSAKDLKVGLFQTEKK